MTALFQYGPNALYNQLIKYTHTIKKHSTPHCTFLQAETKSHAINEWTSIDFP